MMKFTLPFLLCLFLLSCGNGTSKKEVSAEDHEKAKQILLEEDELEAPINEEEEEFQKKIIENKLAESDTSIEHEHREYVATYYILVADTNLDYHLMRDKMLNLSSSLKYPIDTLERTYLKDKDLIALPIDDPDPIYAGEYFQRRFPSKNLSLEYLNAYQGNTREKNIGIVAGIYEKERDALHFMEKIKSQSPQVFIVKAKIYLGCIH